jgi:AraC family transcriptional regulator of adaptative response/methylated-DNA-[protein]-cysteine methyltransferase
MNTAVSARTESPDAFWAACQRRDRNFDGRFVFAVRTTGIYCRPSCPARSPKRDNVMFFAAAELARQAGFRACKRCHPDRVSMRDPAAERALAICHYLRSARPQEPLTLARLGRRFSLSPAHLQRAFKQYVGISPLEYLEACRMDQLKLALRNGATVTQAIYDAGYGSSSRVYERAAASIGMTPRRYRARAAGERIAYSVVPCALGVALVATTARGICAVKLGDEAVDLERELREEFSAAQLSADEPGHADWVRGVVELADGRPSHVSLPLDVRGTAFQKRVWNALKRIPRGATRSYAQIAASIGRPEAVRAVANACAANPTALVVPCHRVLRSNGDLGGYHWGVARKQRLLSAESQPLRSRRP